MYVNKRRGRMGGGGNLSKLKILVAQLESIVAAAAHQQPDPLICFDLLVDLLSTINQESKESILPCQRTCEDALQALLMLGVRPPVRRLAARAIVCLIEKGDSISIYSRTSNLQGWLLDKMDRKSDPASCIGVTQCLGALVRAFGMKVYVVLVETNSIVAKLMRFTEVSVRQAALELLQDALEGLDGGGPAAGYTESLRIITKLGVNDKAAIVRAAAAGCLRLFATTEGPGLGVGSLENCAALCLKGLEDPAQSVRDGFAAALGALLAVELNPQAQDHSKGRGPRPPSEPIGGRLQKSLITPFVGASGLYSKEIRVGLTMAWLAFLQGRRLTYVRSDLELQEFAMQMIGMLASSYDTHSQACVLFCLRIGIVEQMEESAQKLFMDHLIKQLSTPDTNPSILVVVLRTLSHLLATLGEVSMISRDAIDSSLVSILSNSSIAVRVEAALALRTLAEVDTRSANNLLSVGVTTLRALRETVAVEKGDRLRLELDSLHGHAAMLAAIISAYPRVVLGVPSRLLTAVSDVAKAMVIERTGNPVSVGAEIEAGWMLIASILSSMPREELDGQKFDFLVLWIMEFGGNLKDLLKKAESMLLTSLSRWSAAVEALTAFLKSFVMPNMSPVDEGIILQPLLGYLSRALAYLLSSTVQQAPAGLNPAVDLFTIRILRAFGAIPDPFTYKPDHPALLSICTGPFRDPASYGASSCLRHLLDSRDASLGPWIPGRDSFEDELRAFEGGAEGLLPCLWANEGPVFPQRLPLADVVLDEMLLCFGNLFATEMEQGKLFLLEIVGEAFRVGKKQTWHSANITNTCVALLAGLKASVRMRSVGLETNVLQAVQEILQGILVEGGLSPAVQRAASEGLGILARLGSAAYAARLTRFLQTIAGTPPNSPFKGSVALALGCVHRSVGGMALSSLVPVTVQTLCSLAKDPSDGLYLWSLHGLWLTADAAGLTYVPHVQATLSLVMELLLSEEHAAPELGQSIGRLINAVVAVLGPELSPGSSLFIRCKAVVAEIGTANEPAALLECVLFTQQLALFAPLAVPVHAHVKTLRPTLTSRQPSLRQAAASTFRHLSERDAVAMCEERIEEDLFAMLDKETDESIIQIVRSTLERLLVEACPSLPSRWLNLCRKVVLATSTIKSAGADAEDLENLHSETGDEDDGEDDDGMIVERNPAGLSGAAGKGEDKTFDNDQLPRFKTRVFAAECLCRLPIVVGVDPAHFNLSRAKELQNSGDWLVLHLGELVAVAYQVATGTMEKVRPMGVELLDTILDKFAETQDPLYEGHLLLEQYQAQLVSAVRSALDASAGPLLVATGSRLAARIITSGNASGDIALLHRLVSLLTQSLLKWDDIVNANYAEWVGCKVQVSLLGAHAAVKTYAFASADGGIILPLLTKHAGILHHKWIGLLRDYTALRLLTPTKLPSTYQPFLSGIQIVTIAQSVHQYLSEVWRVVLEAVTVDASPAAITSSLQNGEVELRATQGVQLTVEDFCQVWALPVLVLRKQSKETAGRRRSATGFPSFNVRLVTAGPEVSDEVAALKSLRCLCSKEFYAPDMLSLDLCKELVQIISTLYLKEASRTPSTVLSLLDQIVKSCPQVYMECKSIALQVVELCLNLIFQHLTRDKRVFLAEGVDGSDDISSSAMQILGNLVGQLNAEGQSLLLPHLLSAGVKLLNLVPMDGTVASSALGFVLSVTTAIAKSVQVDTISGGTSSSKEFNFNRRASILVAAVGSLAQISVKYATEAREAEGDQIAEGLNKVVMKRCRMVLEVMVAMVDSIPELSSEEEECTFKKTAQEHCISCLRFFLCSSDVQVRLAALQTLRTVAQAKSVEQPIGETHKWTTFLLCELGADIMQLVYNFTEEPLTTLSAAAVGESLKVLILLHSLVQGSEAQKNVLHLLLPAIIAAATAKNEDSNSQSTAALRPAALKLVTHLASVPSSAAQFRSVLLELPTESRQQLQGIIKASMPQQSASASLSSPVPSQLRLPKPLIPAVGGKSLLPFPSSYPKIPPATVDNTNNDDWDDFQHNTDTPVVSIPEPLNTGDALQGAEESSWKPQPLEVPTLFQTSSPRGLKGRQSLETPGTSPVGDEQVHPYQAEEGSTFDDGSPKRMSKGEKLKPVPMDDTNHDDWDDFQDGVDTLTLSIPGPSEMINSLQRAEVGSPIAQPLEVKLLSPTSSPIKGGQSLEVAGASLVNQQEVNYHQADKGSTIGDGNSKGTSLEEEELKPVSVNDSYHDDWDDFQHSVDPTTVAIPDPSNVGDDLQGIKDGSSTSSPLRVQVFSPISSPKDLEGGKTLEVPGTSLVPHHEIQNYQVDRESASNDGSPQRMSMDKELKWEEDKDSQNTTTLSNTVTKNPT